MMTLSMPLSIATSVPFLNCIICQAWRFERLAARIHHDQLGAALGGLLEEGRGDRMVLGRVGADHDDDVGVLALVEGRGHRRRADAFEQRRDRRGVAEPRAVIDVVGPKPVRTSFWNRYASSFEPLAEPKPASARGPSRSRILTRPVAARSIASSQVAGRKCVHGLDGSTRSSACFGDAVLADHRLRQPLRIADVVEAEAALDAEPVLVGRAVLAADIQRACRP